MKPVQAREPGREGLKLLFFYGLGTNAERNQLQLSSLGLKISTGHFLTDDRIIEDGRLPGLDDLGGGSDEEGPLANFEGFSAFVDGVQLAVERDVFGGLL